LTRLEKVQDKRNGGPETERRIIIAYPDGRAHYLCGGADRELERGETWPIFDDVIRIEYDSKPLPNFGDEVDLTTE
jgi:hypothetical protein